MSLVIISNFFLNTFKASLTFQYYLISIYKKKSPCINISFDFTIDKSNIRIYTTTQYKHKKHTQKNSANDHYLFAKYLRHEKIRGTRILRKKMC